MKKGNVKIKVKSFKIISNKINLTSINGGKNVIGLKSI